MSVSVKAYDFSIPPNGFYQLQAVGEYFRILSATGPLSVTGEFGEVSPLLMGQGLKDSPFTRLQLKDISGIGCSGKIIVASKEFVDQQIILSGAVVAQKSLSTFVGAVSYSINTTWWAGVSGPATGRRFIIFQNKDASATVWICPASQTTTAPINATDGFRLAPGEKISFDGSMSALAWWLRTDIANANLFIAYSD
jgi:hypothetical protein